MSMEIIVRLSEIKGVLCFVGAVGLMILSFVTIEEYFRNYIVPTILGIILVLTSLVGLVIPTTEQYLALQMAKENPPKTAEETLEIIKKSQIDYHHLRAERKGE